MAKRGRKQAPGLRWHTTKGWYRLYDGKPKYFGGSGSRGNSAKRKNNATIKNQAEKRWHEYEADHLFGGTLRTLDRGAGRIKGFAEAAHLVTQNIEVGDLTDEQRNQFAERLRITSVRFFNELASRNECKLGSVPRPESKSIGHTCQNVTDAYLAYLKTEAERDPETKRGHYIDAKGRLKHWLNFIGCDTPLSDLTRNDFLRYRDLLNSEAGKRNKWLKKQPQHLSLKELRSGPGISQSSVNKLFVLVKGAFTAANREAGIVVSGIDDMLAVLRQSKARRRELPLITPKHFQRMLSDLDEQFSLMSLIAMNIAGSNADIARLKWTHIRDDGVFDWSRDKNVRIRRIPLWKRTIKVLKKYRQTSKSKDYIFTTSHGNPYQHSSTNSRKDQLSQQFSSKMDALRLPYTFGALRKSATTTALIAGANETVIKMILGLAGDEVWRHYGMTVPDVVSNAIHSVEEFYFGGKKRRSSKP